MSDHAKTVLWLGLIMIVSGIVLHWADLKTVIFGSGSSGGGGYVKTPKTGKCPPGYSPSPGTNGKYCFKLPNPLI